MDDPLHSIGGGPEKPAPKKRPLARWSPLGIALVAGLALAGGTAASPLDVERQRELTYLVRQDCGSCHGMTLKGGLGGPLLPENLVHLDSEGIASIILDGVSGKPMPPWQGQLSDAEARWIAENLKKGFPQ